MHTRSLLALSVGTGLLFGAGAAAQYPTLTQINNQMRAAANSFPAICQFVDLNAKYGTPLTHQGRRIYAVKISDNVTQDENEPAFFMAGAHHGKEEVTPVICLDAINRLTTGYASDPTIRRLVDSYEIWIVSNCSPDGYVARSRTNQRPGGGVDLNRNYPFLWNTPCSGSSIPGAIDYKGPFAGSEPETQTIMALSMDRHFTKVLDYHSAGREALYGYAQLCTLHRLRDYLRDEAVLLSENSSYGGQIRGPSANGEHYEWQLGTFSNYAFLTETHLSVQPPYASAVEEAIRVWPGTVWMLQRAIPVSGDITDSVSGAPVVADIQYLEYPFTHGEQNQSERRHGRYHAFVPNGTVTLRVSHPSYVTQDVVVNVAAGGVVQDIQLVPIGGVVFDFPNGIPGRFESGGGTVVRVDAQPGAGVPQPGTGVLHIIAANESRSVPMTQVAPNSYDAVFPAFQCNENFQFSFDVDDTTGRTWSSPPVGSYVAAAFALSPVFTDEFEVPSGWVGGQPGDTARTGIWNRQDPEPTGAQTGDDHTPAPGTDCWATDGRSGTAIGDYDVDDGFTTLMSPAYDLSVAVEPHISYWRWFSNDLGSNRDDRFRIDISGDNGGSWVNVETLGPLGSETVGGWRQHSFRVRDFISLSSQVRMRFIAEDVNGGSIVECAVDDFVIAEAGCDGEVVRLGAGCQDSTGTTLSMTHSGSVRIGQSLEVGLTSGAAQPFVLVLGISDTTWLGSPLPIQLPGGPLGCVLAVSGDLVIGPFAAGATFPAVVPNTLSAVGISLYWQAVMPDPGLATGFQVATSDYFETTFGN